MAKFDPSTVPFYQWVTEVVSELIVLTEDDSAEVDSGDLRIEDMEAENEHAQRQRYERLLEVRLSWMTLSVHRQTYGSQKEQSFARWSFQWPRDETDRYYAPRDATQINVSMTRDAASAAKDIKRRLLEVDLPKYIEILKQLEENNRLYHNHLEVVREMEKRLHWIKPRHESKTRTVFYLGDWDLTIDSGRQQVAMRYGTTDPKIMEAVLARTEELYAEEAPKREELWKIRVAAKEACLEGRNE